MMSVVIKSLCLPARSHRWVPSLAMEKISHLYLYLFRTKTHMTPRISIVLKLCSRNFYPKISVTMRIPLIIYPLYSNKSFMSLWSFNIVYRSSTCTSSCLSDFTSASPSNTINMNPSVTAPTCKRPDTSFCRSFSKISKKTT